MLSGNIAHELGVHPKEEVREEVIFFNNSGHGHFDFGAYDAFLHGKLVDYE